MSEFTNNPDPQAIPPSSEAEVPNEPQPKKNGWKTASKAPVKNQDLWQDLDALSQNRPITWEWVAAHNGEAGNERADMLARQGIVTATMGINHPKN